MLLRRAPLILLLALGACAASGADPKDKKDADRVDFTAIKHNSRNRQTYIDALLLAGSPNPADWMESKKQFDLVHPFFVFQEGPSLIAQFKNGSEQARKELARRGMLLRAVVVLSSGYDRIKWEESRKTLM